MNATIWQRTLRSSDWRRGKTITHVLDQSSNDVKLEPYKRMNERE